MKKAGVIFLIVAFTVLMTDGLAFAKNPASKSEPRPSKYVSIDSQLAVTFVEEPSEKNLAQQAKSGLSALAHKVKETVKGLSDATRGDPKTEYHKSENRLHSAVQRERLLPPPPPPPVPEVPVYLADLHGWLTAYSLPSTDNTVSTLFTPVETGDYDSIMILYDLTSGNPVRAIGFRTTVVSDFPDLTGKLLVLRTTDSDGSVLERYAVLEEGMTIGDIRNWVEVHYDPAGNFVEAIIRTSEELSVGDLYIPPLP